MLEIAEQLGLYVLHRLLASGNGWTCTIHDQPEMDVRWMSSSDALLASPEILQFRAQKNIAKNIDLGGSIVPYGTQPISKTCSHVHGFENSPNFNSNQGVLIWPQRPQEPAAAPSGVITGFCKHKL